MSKTIVVVGFGPGISTGVAEKFGAEGFSVALLARDKDRLASGVAALKAKGINAAAFPADAGDPSAIRDAIGMARSQFGPITAIHWNAIGGSEAGDLVAADPVTLRKVFDVAVFGLLAAVDHVLPDLRNTKGAVLVTNGAFGDVNPQIDEYAVQSMNMGLALANAAKHKLVGLLAQRLRGEGVYVGEVMIAGSIKGTAWATEKAMDPADVGNKFWELFQARDETRARLS